MRSTSGTQWESPSVTTDLLSHRTFSCSKACGIFLGTRWRSLLSKAHPSGGRTMHRAHHRHVDTPLDPHSPRYGLNNAHVGWLTAEGISSTHRSEDAIERLYWPILFIASLNKAATSSADTLSDSACCFAYRIILIWALLRLGACTREPTCWLSRSTNSSYAQCVLPHSESLDTKTILACR